MENASEMINARPYLHEAPVKDFDLVYHGTHWECAPRILATGVLSESDNNLDLGEREFHGVTGTYSSPNALETLIGYGWPVNVFGNNCYYSIGFELFSLTDKLKKTFHRTGFFNCEKVFKKEALIISRVIVLVNRSVLQGKSRAPWYDSSCEFGHGIIPSIRLYPVLRPSRWSDFGCSLA
jgi:hypothetical protein